MADPGKEHALGMIMILLAISMGLSEANMTNGCLENGIVEAIRSEQSHDTINALSISSNNSPTNNQASDLHDGIDRPDGGDIVDGKRFEAHDLIRAEVGQPFNISLESNPTTGYAWTVDFDNNFLSGGTEMVGAINIVRPSLIGAGGWQIFSFTPIREGRTVVSAIYKRSWEKNAAEERMFLITIEPAGS